MLFSLSRGSQMKITDKLAFEDAQIMAEIAYRKMDAILWFAAMQVLKAAYKGNDYEEQHETISIS